LQDRCRAIERDRVGDNLRDRRRVDADEGIRNAADGAILREPERGVGSEGEAILQRGVGRGEAAEGAGGGDTADAIALRIPESAVRAGGDGVVATPAVVMRPTTPPCVVNQRAAPGPAAIEIGCVTPVGNGNSVTTPSVVMRPI
jgi:hypothetical protein